MKSLYTKASLTRLRSAKAPSNKLQKYERYYNQMRSAVSGVASIARGVQSFDIAAISEGLSDLGPVIKAHIPAAAGDWYSSVDLMHSLSQSDFPMFKLVFFNNECKESENMRNNQMLEHFTYFVMVALGKVVRNR